MVLQWRLREGEHLDETVEAKEFGVSRTSVREALQRQVSAHLSEQRPRRGGAMTQPASMIVIEIEMFHTMADLQAIFDRRTARRATLLALPQLSSANELCLLAVGSQATLRPTRVSMKPATGYVTASKGTAFS